MSVYVLQPAGITASITALFQLPLLHSQPVTVPLFGLLKQACQAASLKSTDCQLQEACKEPNLNVAVGTHTHTLTLMHMP